jgi:unsaturated rhamnogalacturonyl hydrolase
VLMFTYAFAKGARLGYLPGRYAAIAAGAWKAIGKRFVLCPPSGQVEIAGTVSHVALGATVTDDGSYRYYLHAPVVVNDPKGIGAFLLAGSEMELRRR